MSFEGTVQMCICEKYFELKMYDVFHHQNFFQCNKQIDNISAYSTKVNIFIIHFYITNFLLNNKFMNKSNFIQNPFVCKEKKKGTKV